MKKLYTFIGMVQSKKDKEAGIPPNVVEFFSIGLDENVAREMVISNTNGLDVNTLVNKGEHPSKLSKDWG